jgi:hypothetical protein
MRTDIGELDGYDFLQGVLSLKGTSCARRVQFESAVRQAVKNVGPYDPESIQIISDQIDTSTEIATTLDDVRYRVLGRELAEAAEWLETHKADSKVRLVTDFSATQSALDGYLSEAITFYRTRGLHIDPPEVYLVRHLPEPFGRRGGSILALDADDERRFGTARGIYFTHQAMTPVFAPWTVAHEVIHTYLGQLSPDLAADLVEEGVAEFTSTFDYLASMHGDDVASSVYKMHRLTSACGLRWDLYVESAECILAGVMRLGGDALYQSILNGRDGVRAFRDLIDTTNSPVVEPSNLTRDMLAIASDVLLKFNRRAVVSPLAFEIARVLRDGISVRETMAELRMSRELTVEGMKQLESAGHILLRADDLVVEFAPVRDLVSRGDLRFDFQ